MKWYTADLHLKHDNVLVYDERPFDTIEEHDNAVIDSINYVCGKDDSLYILWDISWKGNKSIELLKTIKCKNIFFTPWNHDFSKYVRKYEEELWWTNIGLMHIDKEAKVVLSHYPIEERYHSRHKDWEGYLHIHWHSHGNWRKILNRIDVWMTFKDYDRPVSLEELLTINEYNAQKDLSEDD